MDTLEFAVAFHHATTGDQGGVHDALARLHQLTAGGDYAYYTDIAHFMAGLPLPDTAASQTRWIDDPHTVRERWRTLATTRHDHATRPGS